MQTYAETIFGSYTTDTIEQIELLFGGNHGKGAFIFLMTVIVRFQSWLGLKDEFYNFQLGQIDTTSDTANLLQPLVKDLEVGIKKLQPGSSGTSFVKVTAKDTKLQFAHTLEEIGNNQQTFPMKFFLVGDIKFVMMLLGLWGYKRAYCMYCCLKQSEWKKIHTEKNAYTVRQRLIQKS